ncbi:MAG: alpha-L-fucosidase, partial [Sarcina sp.]
MIYSEDFPMSKAKLFNGATLGSDNYIVSQGGPSKGYSVLTVSIPYYGRYNLVLTRRNGEVRPLNVDINGVNTGTVYSVPIGAGRKFIIYDVIFNIGDNTIKFYGDGSNNYSPDLLTATAVFVSSSLPNPSINYNTSNALLVNGASIDNLGYSVSNGGPSNGYTIFNVKVLASGIYNLSINYRHHQTGRPLKIDVNSINTGTIYNVPYGDPGVFTTKVNLTLGINTIKFYGDGSSNYSPDLGNLTLTLVTPIPITPDKYLVPNASTLPNIYQLRNIDMKYGMFIHFGINTFVDQEWTDGSIHPSYYAPPTFEIERWAELAWEAGMNYIVSITKHHDGFSVRDSVSSDYDAAASKNSLDVTKTLAKA